MLGRETCNTEVPRDPVPILDRHPTIASGSARRAAFVAVVIAAIVAGYLVFLLGRPEPQASSYDSARHLASAIRDASGECRDFEGSLSSFPGQEIGVCRIGQAEATLTVFDDPSMLRPAAAPPPSSGITWVVGPNWIVATDRASAELLGDVTHGRIVGE